MRLVCRTMELSCKSFSCNSSPAATAARADEEVSAWRTAPTMVGKDTIHRASAWQDPTPRLRSKRIVRQPVKQYPVCLQLSIEDDERRRSSSACPKSCAAKHLEVSLTLASALLRLKSQLLTRATVGSSDQEYSDLQNLWDAYCSMRSQEGLDMRTTC